ncbi:MAG TPA: hypothetical protein VIX12_01575 [Candidatus Binataceae bacterium]
MIYRPTIAGSTAESRPFPDVILRSQFFELMGSRVLTSEQRLMLAVLADAINIVQEFRHAPSERKKVTFNEAWNWIFAKSVRSPLSFANVCDALGINGEGLKWRLTTIESASSDGTAGVAPLRLRLKEASRAQRLTVNRIKRRDRRRSHRVRPAR